MNGKHQAGAWVGAIAALMLVAGCDPERDPNTAPKSDGAPQAGMDGGAKSQDGSADAQGDRLGDSTQQAGKMMDDSMITARVKSALLADDRVKGLQINVDTRGGVVTLRGEVENQSQANRAVEIAGRTEGVRRVDNQLTVKAGG